MNIKYKKLLIPIILELNMYLYYIYSFSKFIILIFHTVSIIV